MSDDISIIIIRVGFGVDGSKYLNGNERMGCCCLWLNL